MNSPTASDPDPRLKTSHEWMRAMVAIENYLEALQIHDRPLRERVSRQVLERAQVRSEEDLRQSPTTLALEEMERLTTEWYCAVLGESRLPEGALFAARGRLALLMAEVAERWPEEFLQPGPWAPEFVQAMRSSFLHAGPDFQLSQMQPRPIDLGPIVTLTKLSNLPYFRMIFVWIGFAILLGILFRLTHS